MKLLSCTIENYGKLKKQDFTFQKGVTAFCEENGYGKTTLASFIKAMFYGLETYRKGGEFCDRVRFYPFEGGAFGGNLTFETGGKIYKIERFFDEKSETRDSLTVYCDGKPYTGFGQDIGKSLFGIDKTSFERTVFIGAGEIEIASTGSINAKLNAFVEGGDDNLEVALSALEAAAKTYKKSRTGNDLITVEKNKIAGLKEEIANCESVKAALFAKYSEYDTRKAEIATLEKEIVDAQKNNVVVNNWEHYDALLAACRDDEAKLVAIRERYPFGIPAEDQTSSVIACLAEEERLEAKASQKTFTEADEANFTRLAAVFAEGIPSEQKLAESEQSIGKIATLSAAITVAESGKRTEAEERLCRTFAHGVPSKTHIEQAAATLEQWKVAERQFADTPPTIPQTTAQNTQNHATKKEKLFALCAALCAFIVCVGVALLFVMQAVGIALLCVGGAGLLLTVFLYLNAKLSRNETQAITIAAENPARVQKQAELRALSDQLKVFLLPYGYNSENGIAFDFARCKQDIADFSALQNREEQAAKTLSNQKEAKRREEENLTAFFAQYGYSGEGYVNNLSKLRADCKTFTALAERRQNAAANAETLQKKMEQNMLPVGTYCTQYNFDYATIAKDIGRIEADSKRYAELAVKAQEDKERAKAFFTEKNLTERPAEEAVDLDVLNERLHAMQRLQSGKLREIESDESIVERLDDLQSEREQAEEKLATYKKKFELLTKTQEFLSLADQALKDRYIKPIKDKFLTYAEPLERALGERVTMTKDFEIRFERSGKERSEKHLSSGQRSLCALCFRLALIDNMYASEKPFLILDDPFVNLDKAHMERVKTLLSEVSCGMQIIYFSCHESRDLS